MTDDRVMIHKIIVEPKTIQEKGEERTESLPSPRELIFYRTLYDRHPDMCSHNLCRLTVRKR